MDDDKVDIRRCNIEFHSRNSLENASSSSCTQIRYNWHILYIIQYTI